MIVNNVTPNVMHSALALAKKPSATNDYRQIIQSLKPEVMDSEELIDALLSGESIRPGVFEGRNWVSQQFFFIDIDKELTAEQVIVRCKKASINPTLIYRNMGCINESEPGHLCIVFKAPEPVADLETRNRIQWNLIYLICPEIADRVAASKEQFFLGSTKKYVHKDAAATIDIDYILSTLEIC